MKWAGLSVAVLFLSASGAWAETIDFRNASFSSIHGQSSFTVALSGGVTMNVSTNVGTFTHNIGVGGDDGLGINSPSYEFDEIEGIERVRITFSRPVKIDGMKVTDLFRENRNSQWYNERGSYSIDGGARVGFTAPDGNLPFPITNGELDVAIGKDVFDSFTLSAPGYVQVDRHYRQDHEFSLASLDVTVSPIPEPATWVLLGTGALGLLVARRRRHLKDSSK